LKKCRFCSAINQDYDFTCGVCGESLSASVSQSLEVLEAEMAVQTPVKAKLNLAALAGLFGGLATVGFGFFLILRSGPIGLILLLAGVVMLTYAFNIEGSTFGVPGTGRGSAKRGSLKGKIAAVRREIGMPELEEEKEN
jgi:hypothetical protein